MSLRDKHFRKRGRAYALPPRHPTILRLNNSDKPIKLSRRAQVDPVCVPPHLHAHH
jgi:hypothetical protein